MAIEESQLVTLKGLNQVYSDLRERIKALSKIYHVKGTLTWAQLMALESAEDGDVYNIKVSPDDPVQPPSPEIVDGTNVYCILNFTSPIDPNLWDQYWDILSGFVEVAADDTLGVIKTGSTIASPDSPTATSFNRGVRLNENDQAYTTIPAASDSSYGVVTTGAQNFAGAKNFTGDTTLNGFVTLNTTSKINTVNDFEVKSLKINDAVISSAAGVITFSI